MISILGFFLLAVLPSENPSNLHRVLDVAIIEVIEPESGDTIPPGDEMRLIAKFRNLGTVDAETLPATCKIYNTHDESPPDQLLYQKDYRIKNLYWRGSEKDSIIESVVDFGSFEVPETTIPGNPLPGRYMRIEFGLAETWMDYDPMNNYKTIYINSLA